MATSVPPVPDDIPKALSITAAEARLRAQKQEAAAAIRQTAKSMRASLSRAGDVRAWVRRYPLSSLLSGAVAGFLITSPILPLFRRRATPSPSRPHTRSHSLTQIATSALGIVISATLKNLIRSARLDTGR